MPKLLFRPISISSLVFFRICFGLLAFADVLGTFLYYHLEQQAYAPGQFRFAYYGFEWLQPLPEPLMSTFFVAMLFGALSITLGWFYRFWTTFYAFGFTYLFLLEKAHYLNHGYLFCWICFLLIFLPAHRELSLDVLRKPEKRRTQIPAWCLYILPFLMGVVYFYGGIAKLNADWLQAMPLKLWLKQKSNLPLIGPILSQPASAYFMAYGGLLLDLTVVFLLLFRRSRLFALVMVLFFHFVNFLVFNIGIFPLLSISLTLLFFPPDLPLRLFNKLQANWRALRRASQWWAQKTTTSSETKPLLWQEATAWKGPILAGLFLIATLHLTIPLRHHLWAGDVAWTEEGHRYSWRMMLRSKRGHGRFIVVDKASGEHQRINSDQYLRHKQKYKLFTHPDMILQFAHYLRGRYAQQGKAVEIYADIKVGLNGRAYCTYIDPDTDLAQVRWHFRRSAAWILPEAAEEQEN